MGRQRGGGGGGRWTNEVDPLSMTPSPSSTMPTDVCAIFGLLSVLFRAPIDGRKLPVHHAQNQSRRHGTTSYYFKTARGRKMSLLNWSAVMFRMISFFIIFYLSVHIGTEFHISSNKKWSPVQPHSHFWQKTLKVSLNRKSGGWLSLLGPLLVRVRFFLEFPNLGSKLNAGRTTHQLSGIAQNGPRAVPLAAPNCVCE